MHVVVRPDSRCPPWPRTFAFFFLASFVTLLPVPYPSSHGGVVVTVRVNPQGPQGVRNQLPQNNRGRGADWGSVVLALC